ncbi:sialidase family protein [Limnoglobus roseus]|uniref:Putative retaining sialidase n=1 Tax=Limnoglobus roseus TaxID=2598579 RepID=A0A5C1A833_9BACT|nr:sialidase family protein [Limnoglobus roseus]QEL14910.1 putative retaining sialidase [Limnoglobus roseus]
MFIFEKAPFPSCHASTLVEHEPGKLMAAWFGGTAEKAPDVQIWASTFDGKAWSEPQVLGTQPKQPCWNPVLFKLANGTLALWYKIGPDPVSWVGYLRRSSDAGKTWSKPEVMPAGFYGPVRAKPIQLKDGTLLAGTSVEAGANATRTWTPFVDRSTDDGKTWWRSSPFNVPGKHAQIQPTLFEASDGRIVALMRSANPLKVCRSESKDGGKTFTPAAETDLFNPSAGIDVVKTTAGDLFLIYNPVPVGRVPLSLARSTDDGQTWVKVHDLETELGEYSYPAIIQSADGQLQMTYTWRRTHIKHVAIDPATLRK